MSFMDEDEKTYRRNYKACLNCRTRKVRCDLGPLDAPHDPPCARCKRERKECVFAESRRGGSLPAASKRRKLTEQLAGVSSMGTHHPQPAPPPPLGSVFGAASADGSPAANLLPLPYTSRPVTSAPDQHTLQHIPPHPQLASLQPFPDRPGSASANAGSSLPPISNTATNSARFSERANSNVTSNSDDIGPIPPPRSELTTMQGALVFLARAAGTIARADDRDKINAREIHEQFETDEQSKKVHTDGSKQDELAPLLRPQGNSRLAIPAAEKSSNVRPNPSKSLSDIDYIGEGKMLTEDEAVYLIRVFFLTMHPFFPHIPEQLHSPQVLAGYPILLCAILTIASRYHPFEKGEEKINKNSRNIQLHERLWIYCQRLISQTVWAEASTRSVGTVLAFLLFTEWNPRAIHWRWSDYANMPEKEGPPDTGAAGSGEEETDGLAGLSAMRRSDRMAWMLVGTSVRLAQDMGFINGSSKIFVATHIAETHCAMNLGQRSMLAQSLSEIDLDNDDAGEAVDNKRQFLHDEFILSLDEETMRRRSQQKKSLKFSFVQKAKLELLKIMSLAYETVYCTENQMDPGQHKQNLTILSVLSPLIENWYKTYRKLLRPSNPKNFNHHCNLSQADNPKHVQEVTRQIDKESMICDYYYCQLYIYSLALSMENPLNSNVADTKKPLNSIRLDEITKAAKYIELAYNAAKEILNATVRVHKLKMLKYMPVRWVMRIVRSVAFIVKCYLTLTNPGKQGEASSTHQTSTLLTLSIIPTDDILQTIQKAAIVLREASPDELHLCTRYSTILMYLCSEMKYRSKLTVNPPNVTPLDASDDEQNNHELEQDYGYEHSMESPPPRQRQQPQQPASNAFPMQQAQGQPSSTAGTPQPGQQQGSDGMYFGYQQMREPGVQPLPDAVVDWFMKNDEAIGLDFVEPWTEMIEQHLDKQKN